MFTLKNTSITPTSYENTLHEINQQPALWRAALENAIGEKEARDAFFERVKSSANGNPVRVIFTGAGTSEYVGNVLETLLPLHHADWQFVSVASTDLVAAPEVYLVPEQTTLLVSFARSGNSPESLAAVAIADRHVEHIFHLAITCAPEGALATRLRARDNAYVALMPEGSNDKGFAMTSSFSCMLLSAMLFFDEKAPAEHKENIEAMARAAEKILADVDGIHALIDTDIDRLVYLGSGPLYALGNEARLKILELTAGEVVAINESSMGFRHGPKSIVNPNTIVVGFLSNNPYTRQYDVDILNELAADGIAKKTIALAAGDAATDAEVYTLDAANLQDRWLLFPMVVVAQLFAVIASVHVGNTPDTPSKTGTVNRVVKGVTIHAE